jgi:ABC-type sugar transport system permease subunit
MTTQVDRGAPATVGTGSPPWLLAVAAFQALYAAAAAVATVLIVAGRGIVIDGTLRWVAAAVFGGVALFGALSVPWLLAGRHRGRLTAFLLDLLLAVAAGFVTLQTVNVFNGLDALGATFSRGFPFLGVMIVGWLIAGWADRFGARADAVRLASRWMIGIGFAFLLVAVGLFPGLWTFLTRIVQPAALVQLTVTVVAALVTLLLWRDRATEHFGSTQTEVEVMNGLLFVSPNVLGFLAFLAGPLVFSLFVSFTNWDGLGDAAWVGLRNYTDLFSDPFFRTALRNVLVFGAVAVPLSVAPALGLAVLLNTKLPGMKIFRALYFLPAVAGVVGVALIWKQLYNATVGFINYGLLRVTDVINLLPGLDLTAPQPQWLSSTSTALLSMIIVFAFQTIGFNAVLFLAGLQGVPRDLYEAAEIDGAGPWSKFRNITVPTLAPTTVFVVITTTILALQLFSEPFILMAPQLSPNGPNNATLTPVIYLYQNAFERFSQGYASAIGWVLFLLIFAITLIYFRTQRDEGVLSA